MSRHPPTLVPRAARKSALAHQNVASHGAPRRVCACPPRNSSRAILEPSIATAAVAGMARPAGNASAAVCATLRTPQRLGEMRQGCRAGVAERPARCWRESNARPSHTRALGGNAHDTNPSRPATFHQLLDLVEARLAFQNDGGVGNFRICRLRKAIAAAPSSTSVGRRPGVARRAQDLISAAGHLKDVSNPGALSSAEKTVLQRRQPRMVDARISS